MKLEALEFFFGFDVNCYQQFYRINYRFSYRVLTIGLSYKVPVDFWLKSLQSARESAYKVPVDNSAY